MGVPSFADLGESVRDVFKTGFPHGKSLINIKTKSAKRFELTSNTTLNFTESKFNGLMETKYKANAGTLLLKWTTEGVLYLGCEFNELLMKGVDLLSECSYNPETAARSVRAGSRFANEKINARCEISRDVDSNTGLFGSVVIKCRHLLLGYQGGYDFTSSRATKNDVGVAYGCADIDLHLLAQCTSVPHAYGLSVVYKARPDLDVATEGTCTIRDDVRKWTFGAATKYKIDENSTLRLKLDTDLQAGASFLRKLTNGITLILSFNVDCANIVGGGHKAGLALSIEA